MKLTKIAIGLSLTLAAFVAQAQTLVFSKSLNEDLDTGTVATLEFNQVGNDTVFTLNADWDSDLLGDDVFLSRLFFNYTGATKLAPTKVSGGTEVKDFDYWKKPHTNASYKFNYGFEFTTSNSKKGSRLLDGESLSWTFANTDADDFGDLALVHLQGLDVDCIGSVKVITAPIPEPETYALMGMGLLGVALARRRKAA